MILQAEGLSRTFLRGSGETNIFTAVRSVTLSLEPGTLTEITGRSGSGKSTLLHMLAGLLAPTEGRVLLDGQDLFALDDEARSALRGSAIGVIPQGHTALASLTVLQNALLSCDMYGRGKEAEARALALLERVGIAGLRDDLPVGLSGGELRRVAVVRALAHSPGVVLADEPTGDLDDENTAVVLSLLREAADGGAAVLLVTHEREAEAWADRVLHMQGGELSEG